MFRPVKIYKYVDKRRVTIDFVTHGRAARFENSVLDESLLAEVDPPPQVRRVPTPVLHDLLPSLGRSLRPRRQPTTATAQAHVGDAHTGGDAPRRPSRLSQLYRRLAMWLYFPDHLFLWGYLATLSSVWMHLRRRYDVIYTTSYPESAHLPGLLLQLFGVRWVADYRYGGALWIKKLVGFDKSPLRQRIDLWFQGTVMRSADRVITQSEPMRNDFSRIFGLDPARIDVIPSGYDDADFTPRDGQTSPFARDTAAIHMLHVGVMEGTTDRDRRSLAHALNRLNDDVAACGRQLVLHAVGKHLFDDSFSVTMRFEYRYHGTILHRDLPPYLLSADCYLLSTFTTTTGHDEVRGFIPGKLWEYLRAGKPIVMVGPKDTSWSIIEEAGVGLYMDIDSETALSADLLLRAIDVPRPLHWKVPSYSWEARAQCLQRVFLHLTAAGRREPQQGAAHA